MPSSLVGEASIPNLVTCSNWTPIYERCAIRCGSKNTHQDDMLWEEIGLCAQNLSIVLGSVINMSL